MKHMIYEMRNNSTEDDVTDDVTNDETDVHSTEVILIIQH